MRGHLNPEKRLHSFHQAVLATGLLAKLRFAALAYVPRSLPEQVRAEFRTKLQDHLEDVRESGLPWRQVSEGVWAASPRVAEEPTGSANDIAVLMNFAPEDDREHGLRRQVALEQSVVMY